MNHRRAILGLFAIAALIAGSAGYTTVQAERSVDVAVAGEGEAFLSVEPQDPSIQNGSAGTAFEVTNRLGRDVDLTVGVSTNTGSVELGTKPNEVEKGNSADIDARCTGTDDGTLDVTVVAEGVGGEVLVRVDRSTTVTCT